MLPKKLKDDSIIEALCELRFETDELPEITLGRLSDSGPWKEFNKGRLPPSEIPTNLKMSDAQLKYQADIEFRSSDNEQLVKIGANVISIHRLVQYPGWKVFKPEILNVLNILFKSLPNVKIVRTGFRYINALTSKRHLITDINDLNLVFNVAENKLLGPLNINFLEENSEEHATMTRIATPNFVSGNIPKDASVVIDLDVFSPNTFQSSDINEMSEWIENAHDYEKQAFFRLLTKDILSKLVEET